MSECPACLRDEDSRRLLLTTRKALAAMLKAYGHAAVEESRYEARRVLDLLKNERRSNTTSR